MKIAVNFYNSVMCNAVVIIITLVPVLGGSSTTPVGMFNIFNILLATYTRLASLLLLLLLLHRSNLYLQVKKKKDKRKPYKKGLLLLVVLIVSREIWRDSNATGQIRITTPIPSTATITTINHNKRRRRSSGMRRRHINAIATQLAPLLLQ